MISRKQIGMWYCEAEIFRLNAFMFPISYYNQAHQLNDELKVKLASATSRQQEIGYLASTKRSLAFLQRQYLTNFHIDCIEITTGIKDEYTKPKEINTQ